MENLVPEKFYNAEGRIIVETRSVFSYRLHTHSYYEMILYEPFDGEIAVNGERVEMESGTAVIVSPMSFHETVTRTETDAKYIKVGFNEDILGDMAFDFPLVLEGVEKNGFLHRLFVEISENHQNERYLRHLIQCAVFLIQSQGRRIMLQTQSKGQSVALRALRLINERFQEDISLAEIAEQVAVTPQYLSSAFFANLGINFSKYLANLRLKCAASMIESTKIDITDICFESGYRNFSHFSRSFKNHYGVSPREYRRRETFVTDTIVE